MKGLKDYLLEHDVKKIGITRFYRGVLTNTETSTNPGSLDVCYLYKYLDDNGFDVSIINQTANVHSDHMTLHHYSDALIEQYDVLIFQPYTYIMFGGVWEENVIEFIEKYVKDFQGKTLIIYNDPNITWDNPYKIILNRNQNKVVGKTTGGIRLLDCNESRIQEFESKDVIGLFNGIDFKSYKELSKSSEISIWPTESININLSEYIFKHELEKSSSTGSSLFEHVDTGKQYDLCYFGSDRRGSRSKNLNRLFKKDSVLNKLWIGYDPGFDRCSTLKKQSRSSLKNYMSDCLTSIVIGDDAHNGNIITYRVFENSQYGVFSVIYDEYDPEKKIVQDVDLRKITYFKNYEELKTIVEFLRSNLEQYDHFVEAQRREMQRIILSANL